MKLCLLLSALLLAGCHPPWDRDPKFWIAGQILVTFKEGVSPGEAAVIVTRLPSF